VDKKPFFNNPFKFSFKDFIAMAYLSLYLYVAIQCLTKPEQKAVHDSLTPGAMVILGGYFTQEVASAYFVSKNPNNMMYGGMFGMPYSYNSYTTPTTTVSTDINNNEP
jgi:hypothetical protein